jgi:hypothetical protein
MRDKKCTEEMDNDTAYFFCGITICQLAIYSEGHVDDYIDVS